MKDIFLQAINLLPSIAITIIVAYFYSQKKAPGLLVILIAYTLLTITTACSHLMPYYATSRAMTSDDMMRLYTYIGVASLIAQVLLAVGLAVVLSQYPNKRKDVYDSFS